MSMRELYQRLRSTSGAEIAEAALVLPLVFTLLFGTIWFGRVFNIYSTIQQAAQQGAITAARATCATCSPSNTFPGDGVVTSCPETDPLGLVASQVARVMCTSSVDPMQIIANSPTPLSCVNPPALAPCTSSGNITICRKALLNSSSSPPLQCGVVVSFQYPFTLNFPGTSLNMRKITMTAQAQSRMEN
jgi:hypothetical protein